MTVINVRFPNETTSEREARLHERRRIAHTEDKLAAQSDRNRRNQARRRAVFVAIKMKSGCIDCGYRASPVALHFDHRDPAQKSFSVSMSWWRPMEAILAEIAKCDVRCANCHAIRTFANRHHISRGR